MKIAKILIVAAILTLTQAVFAQAPAFGPTVEAAHSLIWLTDFEQAKAEAAAQKRPILIDFTGSDWCSWCVRLDREVFSQKEFQQWASENVVLLCIDFPMHKQLPKAQSEANEKLSQVYKVTGFPTILLVDAEGKELGKTGYRRGGAVKYVEHLKELLKK